MELARDDMISISMSFVLSKLKICFLFNMSNEIVSTKDSIHLVSQHCHLTLNAFSKKHTVVISNE